MEKGGELELEHGREENGEKREWVVAGGFSSASVARGSEVKKERGHAGASAWQREKEERGPWAWRSATWGSQQWPPTVRRGLWRCHATGESDGPRLTGGAGTSRGPSVSGGVWEGDG
jgi:hypothetical protein